MKPRLVKFPCSPKNTDPWILGAFQARESGSDSGKAPFSCSQRPQPGLSSDQVRARHDPMVRIGRESRT